MLSYLLKLSTKSSRLYFFSWGIFTKSVVEKIAANGSISDGHRINYHRMFKSRFGGTNCGQLTLLLPPYSAKPYHGKAELKPKPYRPIGNRNRFQKRVSILFQLYIDYY